VSNSSSTQAIEDLSISFAGSKLYAFTLEELREATNSFSWSNMLGEGGFGPVYKGFVDDKLRPGLKAQTVAVKRLDLDGLQGHREWLVSWLSQVPFLTFHDHPIFWFSHISFICQNISFLGRDYISWTAKASTSCQVNRVLL